MISLKEALEIIQSESEKWNTFTRNTPLEESIGCVSVQAIISPENYPPFRKSAMDGYAVSSESETYKLVGEIAAGDPGIYTLKEGECFRIFTGAQVPEHCSQVIRQEFCDLVENTMTPRNRDQSNIMEMGEDFKESEVIIPPGTVIHPAHIGLMAGLGITSLEVYDLPKVGLMATGEELVAVDKTPSVAQIRNSNSPMLYTSLRHTSHPCDDLGIIGDDEEELYHALNDAFGVYDVVILTGGASKGKYDYVKPVCKSLGVEFLFEGVRMRPGKPVSYGSFGKKGVFVLPGNPVAAYLCYLTLVRPFITARSVNRTLRLQAGKEFFNKKTGMTCLIPSKIGQNGHCLPLNYHGSGHIHALSKADCVALIPESIEMIESGDFLDCMLLEF